MTAAARKRADPAARPDARAVFIARAEARALLWQAGELELHEAVDVLQEAAVRDGLVAELGQDAVQKIMRDAFAAVRDISAYANNTSAAPDDHYDGLPSTFAALCRAANAKQRRKPPDLPAGWDEMSVGALWNKLNDSRRHGVAASTLAAAEHLVREGDHEQLRQHRSCVNP